MRDELHTLMSVYSRRGFEDWNDAEHMRRSTAEKCLPNAIVENEWEIGRVICGRKQKFIPMPRQGYKKLDWCFFLPKKVGGKLRSLILFIVVNGASKHCIAFRFESAPEGSHGYTHVQLTSKWSKSSTAVTNVPQWLPVSYPAFPIPAENWTELFLAMATAVHGRYGGIDVLLQELFESEQPVHRAVKFNSVLDKRLMNLELDADS